MQFDATLKSLLEAGPADWPRLLGCPADRVAVIDADIATVSGAADKVLRVTGPPDWILHLEFQSSPDAAKPGKLNVYNAVLEDRTGLPVRTAFVLLRQAAFLRTYTGHYERAWPGAAGPYRRFDYDVVRVWEIAPERLMAGIGTLPLAPIGDVTEADVPGVLREMKRRIPRKLPRSVLNQIWTSAYVLMGLRYQEAMIQRLLGEVLGMEESVTYQAIIRKGELSGAIKELQKVLLRQGELRFQRAPSKKVRTALLRIADLETLERLTERVLTAESWEQLLDLPERR
jgi:predicted transposase YdaD